MQLLQVPTPEERKFLDEAGWLEGLRRTPGWGLVLQHMKELVNEARDDRDNSVSSDPVVTHNLHWRWLQRDAMMGAVVGYVEKAANDRKVLLEDLATLPEPADNTYPLPQDFSDFLGGEK